MTQFIETAEGLLNAAHVISIRRVKPVLVEDFECDRLITYLEGTEVRTIRGWSGPHNDLEHRLASDVIPASPGFFVVDVYVDAPHETWTEPVIAWRLDRHAGVLATPITTDGEADGYYGVVGPNGEVRVPCDRRFASIEEFRKHRIPHLAPTEDAA